MALMVMARDPAKMDELALKFATDVENMFARGWDGGVGPPRATTQTPERGAVGVPRKAPCDLRRKGPRRPAKFRRERRMQVSQNNPAAWS